MKEILIRMATPEDAGAITNIYIPYVEKTAITFDCQLPSRKDFEKKIRQTLLKYPYLVCLIENQVVGYAYAGPHMEREAYQWNAVLSVYLDEGYTGYKIGKALYHALIEVLRVQNFKNVYACITVPNAKSIKLHESFGFKSIGIFNRAGFKNESWHDVIWLEKRLGSDDETPEPIIPIHSVDSTIFEKIFRESCQLIHV